MKIKNLRINKDTIEMIASCAMIALTIGGSIKYYSYEKHTQITDEPITMDDTTIYNNYLSHYFDVGEHRIVVSRNDSLHCEIESVPGYQIEKVETSNWRYNTKVTYVNDEPVIAPATFSAFDQIDKKYRKEDDEVRFDKFGTPVSKTNYNETSNIKIRMLN